MYTTYNYYLESYYGTLIKNEQTFNRLQKKAGHYLDYFTFHRIENESEASSAVQDCICEMAEALFNVSGSSGAGKEKKSETTDGYTVAYVTDGSDGSDSTSSLKRKLYSIAEVHLSDTGLLYQGVYDH